MEAIRRCVARGQPYGGEDSHPQTQSTLPVSANRYP